jgi:hypothetical protein
MSKFSETLNNRNRIMLILAVLALLYLGVALLVTAQLVWGIVTLAGSVVMAVAFALSLPFSKRSR